MGKNKLTPDADKLPPHSEEAERAALGCVMLASTGLLPGMEQQGEAEQDSLLNQLRPQLFYTVPHAVIFSAMVQIRMEGHALNILTLHQWLKDHKKLDEAGGTANITSLPDAAPSLFAFPTFLSTLRDKALRRWTLIRRERLLTLAEAEDLSIETLQAEFAEIHERASHIGGKTLPMIRVISPKQARAFVADPNDSLIGEGLLDRAMVATIGGKPGVGKSRLVTTLAVSLARGNGNWMGYPVKCQARTMILQSENSGNRLKTEFDSVPEAFDEWIRVSDFLNYGLAFDKPEFRRELRHLYDQWPFQVLAIDPWNDVISEEGQADYKAALQNIKMVFFGLPKRPLIVIVAHLRKAGRDGNGKPKGGREILEELSGSLALGSESRTVFSVQAASSDLADPRVVFDVAKANDCKPEWLKEYGTRSAWVRANAAFERVADFDWEGYENPGDPERRKITVKMLTEAFDGEKEMKPWQLAERLAKMFDLGASTAARAIGKGGYLADYLVRHDGQIKLKEAK